MIITAKHIKDAAHSLDIHPAAIKAVIKVETPYAIIPKLEPGNPLILNERHWFHRLTKDSLQPVAEKYPHLANKSPGGYCRGANAMERLTCERRRLDQKMRIFGGVYQREALSSISMGIFQVMGFNHAKLEYDSVFEMWNDALKCLPEIEFSWFKKFVSGTRMHQALKNKEWRRFAYHYNGPNYEDNRYHEKLDTEYNKALQDPELNA